MFPFCDLRRGMSGSKTDAKSIRTTPRSRTQNQMNPALEHFEKLTPLRGPEGVQGTKFSLHMFRLGSLGRPKRREVSNNHPRNNNNCEGVQISDSNEATMRVTFDTNRRHAQIRLGGCENRESNANKNEPSPTQPLNQ